MNRDGWIFSAGFLMATSLLEVALAIKHQDLIWLLMGCVAGAVSAAILRGLAREDRAAAIRQGEP